MQFLRDNQLNFMLIMSGVCGTLAFLTLVVKALSPIRRSILTIMDITAMLLLIFDRFAYIYSGDPSRLGYYMVRISNGLVYFLQLSVLHLVTQYLSDLFKNATQCRKLPVRMKLCNVLYVLGAALILISQFTGLYYSFDAQNVYHRAPWHVLCYVIPVLIVCIQLATVLKYNKYLSRGFATSLMFCIIWPIVASIMQIFHYGVSLTNLTLAFVVIMFFVYALGDLSKTIEQARAREHALFEETAEALANAIDAKDGYTRGHSARVAMYSQRIAKEAALSEKECEQVYFAALLHDVGKIGVSNEIINKTDKLTDEEFAQIRRHTILGNQILASIHQSPYLSIGARYHHERYDGKGYPDGLAGEDIPEIARIITVADSFDAMTSRRSYRDPMDWDEVKEQLLGGIGTQFDPRFAKIMLHMMDEKEFQRFEKAVMR